MITVRRTDFTDSHFRTLTGMLDAELAVVDGEDHAFYMQFDGIENIKYAVVAYLDNEPVGCGAIKHFSDDCAEVKRMYVQMEHRRLGVASTVVRELETWAKELGYTACVLETGKRQPQAIGLYTRLGFKIIPNYGQYVGVDNSVCFRKSI
ncbi:MAG TPA: GNAT family N-acetyltransferase [Cyclobacteriaceae bacterium]|nr:GNAT family N-acetyltransferase [Cyclobacteriaceae bacterium]